KPLIFHCTHERRSTMNEFALLFRRERTGSDAQPSPQQMQELLKQWQNWMSDIASQNKLASPGNRLGSEGKVVKPKNIVSDGPYVELKESIGGYILVRAKSIDEAAELAKGCPILAVGGNVEVRPVVAMDDNS